MINFILMVTPKVSSVSKICNGTTPLFYFRVKYRITVVVKAASDVVAVVGVLLDTTGRTDEFMAFSL